MRGVVPVPVGYYGLQGHAGCQGEISCDPLLWGYLGCGFSVAVPIAVPWAHRCCVAAAVRVQSLATGVGQGLFQAAEGWVPSLHSAQSG